MNCHFEAKITFYFVSDHTWIFFKSSRSFASEAVLQNFEDETRVLKMKHKPGENLSSFVSCIFIYTTDSACSATTIMILEIH